MFCALAQNYQHVSGSDKHPEAYHYYHNNSKIIFKGTSDFSSLSLECLLPLLIWLHTFLTTVIFETLKDVYKSFN